MRSLRLVGLLAVVSLVMMVIGCDQNKTPNQPPQEPPPAAEKPADFPRETIPENTVITPPPAVAPAPEPGVTTVEPEPAPAHHAKAAPKATTNKPKEKYATAKKTSGKTYVTKKGDTLQEISQKFYGTTKRWKKIADANKGVIKDPNKLPVGIKIQIP